MFVRLRGQHYSTIMYGRILVSWNYQLRYVLTCTKCLGFIGTERGVSNPILTIEVPPLQSKGNKGAIVIWVAMASPPSFHICLSFWASPLITVTWLHLPQKSQRAFLFFPCKQCLSFAAKTKDSISQKQDPRHLSMPLQSYSFESWVKRPIPCLSL